MAVVVLETVAVVVVVGQPDYMVAVVPATVYSMDSVGDIGFVVGDHTYAQRAFVDNLAMVDKQKRV